MEEANQMIKRKLLTLTLAMVSTIFLHGITLGQDARSNSDIVEISNNGTNISWFIKVPYESATLTVSAPNGTVYRQEFKAGSIPNFSPINNRAEYYGNGRFNFEIVLTPVLSAGVKETLARSRENGTSEQVSEDLRKRGMIPQKLSTSGTFTFENGNLITANDLEKEPESTINRNEAKVETKNPTTKNTNDTDIPVENAQVINDDLVVIGSTCTGMDCINGESFGFDTLRLKENNLRINFNDTSNSGSFPTRDWRIVANDTSNGGAEYLAFEDSDAGTIPFRVFGGAGNNALIVDGQGDVGLGTLNPVVELHMVDGDTPTMRLEQDGSSGFTAQTWDIAGNETNFFVRDVTNASKIPFKIIPNSPDNSLVVGPNGVGIAGDNSPNALLDIQNGKLTVDTNGKLTTASSIEIEAGGIIFPDGTTQTTAGGGGGGGTFTGLGSTYAQHILGGNGTIASFSSITPTIDYNSFGIGTGGATGFFTSTYSIPYNANLASQSATMVTYQIRYRDSDGTGTAANVAIELVGMDINTGGRASTVLFNSNTNAGTGFQTVTVCKSFDTSNFNASVRGMYINVTVTGTAAQQADFRHIQIYKGLSCP